MVLIHKIIDNREILSKILNASAKKYGCSVKYDGKSGVARFSGDQQYKNEIVQEIAGMFRQGHGTL